MGPGPVDLGGGALAPLGENDFVLAELDATGNHLWSRRLGAPGLQFVDPTVVISAAGDVYLKTCWYDLKNPSKYGYPCPHQLDWDNDWTGIAQLGGAPVTAGIRDTVVASFSPSGAHRWSRSFHFNGMYEAGIDACGALVVVSGSSYFDPGCGPIIPHTMTEWPSVQPNIAILRFAP